MDVTLDAPDFPDFSSAIEYSVNTPGAYGHTLLEKKAAGGEFGKDIRGTYLRITIGTDLVCERVSNSYHNGRCFAYLLSLR